MMMMMMMMISVYSENHTKDILSCVGNVTADEARNK